MTPDGWTPAAMAALYWLASSAGLVATVFAVLWVMGGGPPCGCALSVTRA